LLKTTAVDRILKARGGSTSSIQQRANGSSRPPWAYGDDNDGISTTQKTQCSTQWWSYLKSKQSVLPRRNCIVYEFGDAKQWRIQSETTLLLLVVADG